jgi:hypothetical protein
MQKSTLLIVADRGALKAYQIEKTEHHKPAAHLIDSFSVDEAHKRYQDLYSDMAGGFPSLATAGQGNGTAERMKLAAENEMKCFRKLAHHLGQLLQKLRPERWDFAAPSEINGAIIDGLSAECKKTLHKRIPRDLVNTPAADLPAYVAAA